MLVALESTTRLLEPVRSTLLTVAAPIQVTAELPYLLVDEAQFLEPAQVDDLLLRLRLGA